MTRDEALQYANEIRGARAELGRRWRTDEVLALRELIGLVLDPPWWAGTWQVGRLLRIVPVLGPAKTRQALTAAGITSPQTQLGRLTNRQAGALAGWVSRRMRDRCSYLGRTAA